MLNLVKAIRNLLLCIVFSYCNNDTSNHVEIKVYNNKIEKYKLYIANNFDFNSYLDSAKFKNGCFTFDFTNKYDPQLVKIFYYDSLNKKQLLFYLNPFEKINNKKVFNSAFYLEKGKTNIILENDSNKCNMKISIGKENEIYFNFRKKSIITNLPSESVNRKIAINEISNIILKYSDSYYLFESIYNNRGTFQKDELLDLVSLFNDNIKKSKIGVRIYQYINNINPPKSRLQKFSVVDTNGIKIPIYDEKYKLNILIFWASWCLPCRKEIPQIKSLQKSFEFKSVKITSITFDSDKKDWLTAIRSEKVSWQQAIYSDINQKDSIQSVFQTFSIPTIVFLNSSGVEIKRISGFSKNALNSEQKWVKKYIDSAEYIDRCLKLINETVSIPEASDRIK